MSVALDEADKELERVHAENARLRALLSWIEGACVDELPHSEIRAAIERSNEGGDDDR
jgi:hypothetical protein